MRALNTSLYKMLQDGKYTDLKIRCQNMELNVHRVVVCGQSKVFAAMIDGAFVEAATGVIDLPDDEPDIVLRLLEFLYTSEYSSELDSEDKPGCTYKLPENPAKRQKLSSSQSLALDAVGSQMEKENKDHGGTHQKGDFIINAQIYVLADKYDIPALKKYAATRFKRHYRDCMFSANTPISDRDSFLKDFVSSLAFIYENTMDSDRTLRMIACKISSWNLDELLVRVDFVAFTTQYGTGTHEILQARNYREDFKIYCNKCKDNGVCTECRSELFYYEDTESRTFAEDNGGVMKCRGCALEFKFNDVGCFGCESAQDLTRNQAKGGRFQWGGASDEEHESYSCSETDEGGN